MWRVNPLFAKVRILMTELKATRLMMLNWEDQKQGRFGRIKSLDLADKQVVYGWILPTKTAARVCWIWWAVIKSEMANRSQWSVRSGGKSKNFINPWKPMPDWRNLQIYTVIIQNNPVFMVIYAVFKRRLEEIQSRSFALRTKLFIRLLLDPEEIFK